MECPCTETWTPIPLCEVETQQSYVYGLWVSQGCEQHSAYLASMQEVLKELRDELD